MLTVGQNRDKVSSSAAEYLTFVAASGHGGIEAVYADENVWLTQKMMGLLYDVETHTINYHLKKVFVDSELEEDSVIRNFRMTAAEGKSYNTKHYKLAATIAVGHKVNSELHHNPKSQPVSVGIFLPGTPVQVRILAIASRAPQFPSRGLSSIVVTTTLVMVAARVSANHHVSFPRSTGRLRQGIFPH